MELEIGESYKFQDYEGHVTVGATVTGVGNINGQEIIYSNRGNFFIGKLKYISADLNIWEMSGVTLENARKVRYDEIDNLIYTAINASPLSIPTFAQYFSEGTVDLDEHQAVVEDLTKERDAFHTKVAELEKEIVNLKKADKPAKAAKPEVKTDEQEGTSTSATEE